MFVKHLFDLQGSLAPGLRHEEEVEDVGGERDDREESDTDILYYTPLSDEVII